MLFCIILQEAAEALVAAQAAEDSLLAAAQPAAPSARREVPLAPKVLTRSPSELTLTHFPLTLKGSKRPVKYAVYAKSFGAGVGLSINKTATEYPGTGVMTPLDEPITVKGLRTNDTYIFAVAAFDDQGNVVNGLGASSPETLAALPLPLYLCWAHLAAVAVRLKQWALAKR